jgi:tetratricopeptide (TPR) repeat protein
VARALLPAKGHRGCECNGLIATVERECTEALPFVRLQMLGDRWIDELRGDRIAQVVDYLRKELQTPRLYPSNYYSLGAVYMWSGDYRSALAHFDEQIRAALPLNAPGDSTFGMAGTAAWCLGDKKLAIKYWRSGTTAEYAVAGANTRTELLLYVVSLLDPTTFSVESAQQLLIKKASHWRVKNWPGPIAQYILGIAAEQEVRQKAVDREGDPAEPNPMSWQFDFYKLLTTAASAGKEMGALGNGLQYLVNVKGSEYLSGIKFFYFLRLEEFYLARHWLSKRRGLQLA